MERDLTTRIVQDMDPDLLLFLQNYVDSFAKWDLLRFFYANPHTLDTLENIAQATGRPDTVLERELAELAQRGMLEETRMGEQLVYSLTTTSEKRQRLKHFIQSCEDSQFRVKAIFHIIRGSYED